MRTRTSPRNQEILWRQLGAEGKQGVVAAPKDPVEFAEAVLARARADRFTRPRTLRMLEADLQRAKMKRAMKKNPRASKEDKALADRLHKTVTAYADSQEFLSGSASRKVSGMRSIAIRLATGRGGAGDRREAQRLLDNPRTFSRGKSMVKLPRSRRSSTKSRDNSATATLGFYKPARADGLPADYKGPGSEYGKPWLVGGKGFFWVKTKSGKTLASERVAFNFRSGKPPLEETIAMSQADARRIAKKYGYRLTKFTVTGRGNYDV